MNALLEQLGINWKLLLSQVVNFSILLAVLWVFVYKPLLKLIERRNERIKEGLDKANEADIRLKEIDNIGKEKIKKAEAESIVMLKTAESKSKDLEREIQLKSKEKREEMEKNLKEIFKKREEEVKNIVMKDAMELVKKTIIKTVNLKPEQIDSALIKRAVGDMKHEA